MAAVCTSSCRFRTDCNRPRRSCAFAEPASAGQALEELQHPPPYQLGAARVVVGQAGIGEQMAAGLVAEHIDAEPRQRRQALVLNPWVVGGRVRLRGSARPVALRWVAGTEEEPGRGV